MAGAVANQLAEPLERLARAADRFGGGDLAFRTDVANRRGRWVAQEVRDVGVRFNRMAEALEAMVRGQRELLGAISHELRSPLARARIALEIARDRLGGEPLASSEAARPARASDALDDIEKQLVTVAALLGDLLDAARSGLARPTMYERLRQIERVAAVRLDQPPIRTALSVALLAHRCSLRPTRPAGQSSLTGNSRTGTGGA